LVPDEGVLKKAYIGAYKAAKNREEVNKIVSQFDEDVHIPGDLKSKIKKVNQRDYPLMGWRYKNSSQQMLNVQKNGGTFMNKDKSQQFISARAR